VARLKRFMKLLLSPRRTVTLKVGRKVREEREVATTATTTVATKMTEKRKVLIVVPAL
jgi:peroxiredoxin